MTAMRERLARDLRAKVERYGVVVWADPHGEYADLVESVVPDDATFDRFDGSWYALRRRIEPALSASEPRLVLYVDQSAPEEDPMEELRRAGTEYKVRLATLLRRCLADELPGSRVDELMSAVRTLSEAESILASGTAGGPPRLVGVLGTSEPTEIVLSLVDDHQWLAESEDLRREMQSFIASLLGLAVDGEPASIAGKVARHLILVEIGDAVGGLPDTLRTALPELGTAQRRQCRALLDRWRRDERRRVRFVELMAAASADLQIQRELSWHDNLARLDTVPAYDELALGEALRRLDAEEFVEAEQLAAARLDSIWASTIAPDASGRWRELWTVAHAIAQLQRLLTSQTMHAGGVAAAFESYVDQGWRIDRAHRRMELALHSVIDREVIEPSIRVARRAYDSWLDTMLRRFTDALAADGLSYSGSVLAQGSLYAQVVLPRAKRGPVAYFMVDALRYELGHDLADALRRQFPDGDLGVHSAVTLLPSITPVGMANLCPGAGDGLELGLNDNGNLVVSIHGQPVMGPADRVARLRAAHGHVPDLRLDDVFQLGERELGERIAGAELILVRSQEIDEVGESGKIVAQFKGFETTVQTLARAVARLAHRGVRQFVVTADHGFLALTRDLGSHMIIPKPGGKGEVHRRAFVGRGGTAGEALVRVPLSTLGISGDLDVLVPRGLALIAAGGARGFFHGGASPQEMLVPVLALAVQPVAGSVQVIVKATMVPRITGQVFLAKVRLEEDLLSSPLDVRVVPVRQSDGEAVGVIATTDAGDEVEGIIQVAPGAEINVGFRLTASLRKGDKVELQVYEARTDRRIATSKPATAARALEVDDEFA